MSSLLIITIVCFLHIISAQRNPTISFISQEKVVDIGDKVVLECAVEYADEYSVVWQRTSLTDPQDQLFISSNTHQVVPGERHTVEKKDSRFILTVKKLQESDAGIYECQVITGSQTKLRATVNVYVRLIPVISDNSTRSVIASQGTEVQLNCYASGFPVPRISWRRENNELLPTGEAVVLGNVFVIRNVTKDDRGSYYCIADNGVGSGARRTISIEVEYHPYVTVDRLRYGQALQFDMILECHVEAFPSPSISWIKDGMTLNDNQHYKISIFQTADEFTDTTLRIITAEKRQYGFFTCKATNKLGSSEKVIEFFETPNVICPPACGADLYISGDAASLKPFIMNFGLTLFMVALFFP